MKLLMFGLSPVFGGTESFVNALLPYLCEGGVSVSLVNAYSKPLALSKLSPALFDRVIELDLVRRRHPLRYIRRIHRFFHKEKWDAIWLNVQEPDNGDLLYFAKKAGINKRVVVSHSSAPLVEPKSLLRKLSISFSRLLYKRYATNRVSVSDSAGAFAYHKMPFVQISNGIDVDRFRFDANRRRHVRELLNLSIDDFVYCCVARLVPGKNLLFLVDVFKEIIRQRRNSKLLIIGSGPMEKSIRAIILDQLPRETAYVLTDITNVAPYLDAADYFVFPSKSEGFAIAFVEAQCSGLVCFGYENVIPQEARITESVFLVPSFASAADWSRIIGDQHKNTHLKRAASFKSLVLRGFSKSDMAKKYLSILQDGFPEYS